MNLFRYLVRKWKTRDCVKVRRSTKVGLAGLASFLATSGLAERFSQIEDWDSLIVLIVTWFAARLTRPKTAAPADENY